MEFFDLIKKRYSVRSYMSDPVEKEKLDIILEAARLAPTAANRQPFKLIVVTTEGRQEELLGVYNRDWFVEAPLVICACGIPSKGWIKKDGKSYIDVDIAIIMDHFILAATDLGLGTCWIAAFDKNAAKETFGIPKEVEPVIMTPLGYPADKPGKKIRKSLSGLVRYENW